MLEAEVGFVAEAMGGGVFAGHDDVCGWVSVEVFSELGIHRGVAGVEGGVDRGERSFDADAEVAVFVVAGF